MNTSLAHHGHGQLNANSVRVSAHPLLLSASCLIERFRRRQLSTADRCRAVRVTADEAAYSRELIARYGKLD